MVLHAWKGEYLKQLMETVYRLTKRVEVRVSKGMKQRHNQNNDVGVVWQTNNFIYWDTVVRSMRSEYAGREVKSNVHFVRMH